MNKGDIVLKINTRSDGKTFTIIKDSIGLMLEIRGSDGKVKTFNFTHKEFEKVVGLFGFKLEDTKWIGNQKKGIGLR